MNSNSKLMLYVNPAWRRVGIHTTLLFPFWGNPLGEESLFAQEMHRDYPPDTTLYGITDDLTKAHMVLPPYRHQWFLQHDKALFDECVKVAAQAGKPILLDGTGDIEFPINIPQVYVLRIGGYRFEDMRGENRIQIPPAADDLLERVKGGVLELRHKGNQKPVIGFAGWAKLSLSQRIKNTIKQLPVYVLGIFRKRYMAKIKGVRWRERAVDILVRSPLVTTNFLLRTSFSGSTKTAEKSMRELRQELVDVVLASDYGLDVRGDANASTRLYEILSLGRIPVLIDTERILPFSDTVNYQSFSLIVDSKDIEHLPQKIKTFHDSLTDEEFMAMQEHARAAFVEHFRPDKWMPHIIKELKTKGVFSQ